MNNNIDLLLQKYRVFLPYLDIIHYRVRNLIDREFKEEDSFVDDYICLMLISIISQEQTFDCTSENIDLVDALTPQVKQLLADFKESLLQRTGEGESTMVE